MTEKGVVGSHVFNIPFNGAGLHRRQAEQCGFTFLGELYVIESVLVFVVVAAAVALGLRRRRLGNVQPRKADPYLHEDFAQRR